MSVALKNLSVLAMLRRSAEQHPETIAVLDPNRQLTYREFLREVRRVASYLRGVGVQPGTLVASCLPRGVAALVMQVATFTAGAVHVPVDGDLPDEPLGELLAGVDARYLVVERERRVIGDVRQVVSGDRAIADSPSDEAWPVPSPESLAYVIHTSGSTGRPKPVAVSHGAIANSTDARLHRYGAVAGEFVAAYPMAFDACLAGIWWTLVSGGTLRMLAADSASLLSGLTDALSEGSAATHLDLTPSLYRAVLPSITKPASELRRIVLGGEPCPPELVDQHYQRMPHVELVNEYGPTEATVWCTGATLRAGEDVVIGTPVMNTEILVVGADLRMVPPGEFGELCVSGANLAEGYLGMPELTQTVFVPHPSDPARRMYRTGDVGRWRTDGQLELRGRLDDQVKVRGYRVELGGVAAVLRGIPGVEDAVVVRRDSDRLVAYVAAASQNAPDASALDATLRQRAERLLPEYERPSTYIVLRSMPLDRNGKIDRAALPEPPAVRPVISTAYVPATQPDERRVAAILAELLGIDHIGLHDDFIELGGDSLLAARAAHRIGAEFGVDAPIRIVFDLPTVASLVVWLVTAPTRIRKIVASRPPAPDGRLPFTDLQYAAVAHDLASGRNVVAGPHYALSVTYRINGPLNVGALGDAVDELVNRHAALRASLHMRPDEGYQMIRPATTGLLRTAGPRTKLADLVRAEPLEPASGRVFAADLISASDVEHTLSLRAHHVIADDLSIGLIEGELTQLYEGFRTRRDSGLDPAPDYRAVLGRPAPAPSAAELAYWAEKLQGAKPIQLVPEELLRNGAVDHRTRITSIIVPAAEFLRRVRGNRVTLHAALYTMMHTLVAADTGSPEVLLYTVNAARRTDEMARTVGMFSDAVLLRQQNPPGLSFADSLRRAADELNMSYRHAGTTTPTLCQALPDMAAVLAQSQLVVFETIATAIGLRLEDCSILRGEQCQGDYEGLEYEDPAGLNIMVRQEGTALRLIATHDTAFVPADYADRLLRRIQEIVIACGLDGDRPMDSLAPADPWLRAR